MTVIASPKPVLNPLNPNAEHYWHFRYYRVADRDDTFCLPSHRFEEESEYFAAKYLNIDAAKNDPVCLDVDCHEFESFLKVLYPRNYPEACPSLTQSEWISVLRVSTNWFFPSLRAQALEAIGAPPIVMRIALGEELSVSKWIVSGYADLLSRNEPIRHAEALGIGLDLDRALEMCALRESYFRLEWNKDTLVNEIESRFSAVLNRKRAEEDKHLTRDEKKRRAEEERLLEAGSLMNQQEDDEHRKKHEAGDSAAHQKQEGAERMATQREEKDRLKMIEDAENAARLEKERLAEEETKKVMEQERLANKEKIPLEQERLAEEEARFKAKQEQKEEDRVRKEEEMHLEEERINKELADLQKQWEQEEQGKKEREQREKQMQADREKAVREQAQREREEKWQAAIIAEKEKEAERLRQAEQAKISCPEDFDGLWASNASSFTPSLLGAATPEPAAQPQESVFGSWGGAFKKQPSNASITSPDRQQASPPKSSGVFDQPILGSWGGILGEEPPTTPPVVDVEDEWGLPMKIRKKKDTEGGEAGEKKKKKKGKK